MISSLYFLFTSKFFGYTCIFISEIIGFVLSINYEINIYLIFMFYTFFIIDISVIILLFICLCFKNKKPVTDNSVKLTADAIKRILTNHQYEKDCSICLEEIKDIKILECGHYFCNECITESLKTNNKCPVCRLNIV